MWMAKVLQYLNKLSKNIFWQSYIAWLSKIEITYELPCIGRLKPKFYNKKTKQYQYVKDQTYQWRETKASYCSDYYLDVDMSNAQPVLLEQVFSLNGFDTEPLQVFNENREDIIKDIRILLNLDRREAKKFVISNMYSNI